ncbi:MAG: glycosyltransferase, partial [Agathobacter sp.]|nr:glycosyltransferase [Agathobacter sp.]
NYKKPRTTFQQIKEMWERNEVLEEAYPRALEEYNKAIEVLHNTEKEYLNSIEQFNKLAKDKMEADAVILSQIEDIKQHIDEKSNLQNQINIMNNEINARNVELNQKEQKILQLTARAEAAERAYQETLNSTSWKVTKPLRLGIRGVRSLKNEGVVATARKIKNKVANRLETKTVGTISQDASVQQTVDPAEVMRSRLVSIIEVDEAEQEIQRQTRFEKEYKVSIITPLFNTPHDFLVDMIESVKNQTYANWEFCMVNFSTTDFDRVDEVCRTYAEADSRISYHIADENKGISENTNTCLSYATGDYIGLLDHDDIMHPCALYEVMKCINETDSDFVYTDEIKFTETIKDVYSPNFKPDFSMDELRAHNFICHLNVYKTSLLEEAGMYRKEFDGSQDHDIVLRLTEKAKKIVHIPKILYYWRVHQNSVALCIDAKPYATSAGENAVTEQLHRMGEEKQYVESIINNIPCYRVKTEVELKPDVTVVIWNGRDEALVQRSMDSLQGLKTCKCIVLKENDKVLGEMYNDILKTIDTKYALFLCAGLELRSETLIKEFMVYARRKDIATIDCRVISDTNTLYSGGTYLSGDIGMPVKLRCMGGPYEYPGYECDMYHTRAVVASAGLCTFVDMDVWKKSNGFLSTDSKCSMIEYSYRMWKKGYTNLWIPYIEAINLQAEMQQEYINALSNIDGEYEMIDPYMSRYIIDLHLE